MGVESLWRGGLRVGVPRGGMGRRIAGNFGLLTLFKVLSDVFTFGLFVAISRRFGQEGIGAYSFAVGVAGGFAVVADWGLYRLSIKDLSRCDDDVGDEVAAVFLLRVVLSAAVMAALAATAAVLPMNALVRAVVMVVGLHAVLYTVANGLNAVFIARQDMALAAVIDFATKAAAAVAGVALALAGFDLLTVLWVLPTTTALQIGASLTLVRQRYVRGQARARLTIVQRVARQSVVYFISGLVRYVTTRSDVVLLGLLRSAAAAGVYNVAYRVLFMMMFMPMYASLAVFPVISRMHHRSPSDAHKVIQASVGWMILIGVPTSTGLCLVAEPLTLAVFGEAFGPSVVVLQLLAWLFVLACLRHVLSTVMTAQDEQARRTRLETVAAVFAVAGNVVLILLYGPVGAAVAVLAAETLLVVLLVRATRPVLDAPRLTQRLGIAVLGSTVFAVADRVMMDRLPLAVTIGVCAAIYTAVVLSFRTIRRHELRMVREMF